MQQLIIKIYKAIQQTQNLLNQIKKLEKMLNCCKSQPKNPKPPEYLTPKQQYKYSFKQHSHVLINTEPVQLSPYDQYHLHKSNPYRNGGLSYNIQPPSTPNYNNNHFLVKSPIQNHSATISQQTKQQQSRLQLQYNQILHQQQNLDIYINKNIKSLYNEVGFFEKQIKNREMQIKQLADQLDHVVKSRKFSQQKYIRGFPHRNNDMQLGFRNNGNVVNKGYNVHK